VAGSSFALRPFPHEHFPRDCVRSDFRSDGSPVRALFCPARGSAAVIVLHGCGGFGEIDHRLTADLPGYGVATLYVDYFEPTPPPGRPAPLLAAHVPTELQVYPHGWIGAFLRRHL